MPNTWDAFDWENARRKLTNEAEVAFLTPPVPCEKHIRFTQAHQPPAIPKPHTRGYKGFICRDGQLQPGGAIYRIRTTAIRDGDESCHTVWMMGLLPPLLFFDATLTKTVPVSQQPAG